MTELVLDPSQELAVELVLSARVGVVTGGPGTGKTTTLRTALDRLDAQGGTICRRCDGQGQHESFVDLGFGNIGEEIERCSACAGTGRCTGYALAAPTGKAARRMSLATGRSAQTVHRLLQYGPVDGGDFGFQRHEGNPLESELVVIDEASMLDVHLASALLRAVDPERTRIIFVGDVDQLPSVGPGRVFADLIGSGRVPVARLTQLHRAAAESWVCTQAPRILHGELPSTGDRSDFLWFARDDRDRAVNTVVDVVTKVLPARGISQDDIQVLVPQKVHGAGAEVLNTRLQTLLNPRKPTTGATPEPEWKCGPYLARIGDSVIQTSNDYFLGVFNGECGVVEEIRDVETACPVCADGNPAKVLCWKCAGSRRVGVGMVVRFPDGTNDRRITYSKAKAEALHLAYALTIHKSQGSEWPWVVVLVHSTHTRMLTRQLLYTAITRAKKGVVIVGDALGLERAVAETRDAKRNTALVERLRAA